MNTVLLGSGAPIFRNRVARNAFGLLAISMIPTVLGTWAGAAIGLPALMAASPLVASLVFLGLMLAVLFGLNALRDSGAAIPVMLFFTFLLGAWLSGILTAVLSVANGASIITTAAFGTAAITTGCAWYANTTKRDFTAMGGFLFGSVIALIVVSLANIFFQMPLISILISAAAIVIFSLFMVFDVQRIIKGGETNYVLAAVSIYLNIYNIFSSLLQLLLAFDSSD